MPDTTDDDETIGYCRPPKHTQFKPGRSGNPRGRPRKSKRIEALLQAELNRTIEVKENGRPTRMTKRDAIVKQMVNSAMKGDTKPLQMMMDFLRTNHEADPFVSTEADDLALLKALGKSSKGDSE